MYVNEVPQESWDPTEKMISLPLEFLFLKFLHVPQILYPNSLKREYQAEKAMYGAMLQLKLENWFTNHEWT